MLIFGEGIFKPEEAAVGGVDVGPCWICLIKEALFKVAPFSLGESLATKFDVETDLLKAA